MSDNFVSQIWRSDMLALAAARKVSIVKLLSIKTSFFQIYRADSVCFRYQKHIAAGL